jgi:hypothetical protein
MKGPKTVPLPRHETSPDYERFFDNYYNLGPPSCGIERAPVPSGNRVGQKLPVPRRPRRRGQAGA